MIAPASPTDDQVILLACKTACATGPVMQRDFSSIVSYAFISVFVSVVSVVHGLSSRGPTEPVIVPSVERSLLGMLRAKACQNNHYDYEASLG